MSPVLSIISIVITGEVITSTVVVSFERKNMKLKIERFW